MSSPNVLLLSIKPKYVQKILDGQKSFELRKSRPRINTGDFILIYESSPTKALIGWCKVQNIISDTPEKLWEQVQINAGVTYDEFKAYYKKSTVGVAIQIELIQAPRKVALDVIRQKWENFRPPQSFQYLTLEQVLVMEEILNWRLPSQTSFRQFSIMLSESIL